MKLYIDFDGVILNTIDVSYKKIKELYGDNPTQKDVGTFYKNLDWNKFLEECDQINYSLDNLQKLIDSNLYDVTVLTHVHTLHEEEAKKRFLKKYIPKINFIPVTKPLPKWRAIECNGAILVDDYGVNLKEWQEHGGIAIKFSQKEKKYDYIKIKSLDELITLYPELNNNVKRKVKK